MSKENNKEEKGNRRGSKESASGDKKKDSYKAKRSFTRNKTFRSKDNEVGRGGRGRSEGGEKRFSSKSDKPWSSDKSGGDRKKFSSRPGDDRAKPRGERAPRETKEDREQKYQKRQEESGFGEKRERRDDRDNARGSDSGWKRQSTDRPDDRKERGPRSSDRDNKRGDSDRRTDYGDKRESRGEGRGRPDDKRPSRDERPPRFGDRKQRDSGFKKERGSGPAEGREKRSYDKPRFDGEKPSRSRDERAPRFSDKEKGGNEKKSEEGGRRVKHADFEEGKAFAKQERSAKVSKAAPKASDGLIRLNKYLSNAGIASRREADNLILGGTVKVNGAVVDQLGYKINPTDKVTYGDAAVKSERKVYLLLNKPKDYITTVDDPRERKTVMELVSGACRERIYPVGRLDRNTTGLLLFTNDGELTTKLTHPKFGIKKVYHVSLNKGLKPDDFKQIIEGIELEDGMIKADDIAFVGEGKKEVGIEVHSGRNRIVRRIFEHLGYDVLKLDRVVFAGLTKKDLPRGKHRFLTAKEISFLQMIG